MGLLKNIAHHIKQSNKSWSFFAESIGIHKDDIESIGKTDNPDKEFVHALTRKIWSEILEVGDIKYQDYSHYTEISNVVQFTKFSSCGTDAANGTEAKVANVEKVEDDIGRGHGTIQDIEDDMSENKDESAKDNKEDLFTLADVVRTDNYNLLKQFCDTHQINILTYRDDINNTLLHIASEQNAVNILQILVMKYGLYVKLWNKHKASPLHYAVMKGNLDVCKVLIKHNAEICQNVDGLTPIHIAAQKGHINIIKYFYAYFMMKIDLKDKDGITLLHHAVENNHIDVVKYLVEKGANINAQNKRIQTPLDYAIYGNLVEIAKYLVNNGAQINSTDEVNKLLLGQGPLFFAVMFGRLQITKLLVDGGAHINVRDASGETPLHKSAKWSNIKVCEFLCDNGADVNATSCLEETALHKAVNEGDLDICKLLCYKGADIKIRDHMNETAFEKAKRHGNEEIINFLRVFI